ncbi:MAG: hypothetical protein LPK08_02505, partial [Halomonas sp.]|nr:hypothetical protein [Halomonas sp.]
AMFLAYEKGIPNSYWHEVARKALATLSSRRLLATLIQAAKADHRLDGPFAATHDQIAANLKHYAQMLGFAPAHPVKPEICRDEGGEIVRLTKKSVDSETGEEKEAATSRPKWNAELYRNGQAIKRAAWEGRMELILQAKGGGPR